LLEGHKLHFDAAFDILKSRKIEHSPHFKENWWFTEVEYERKLYVVQSHIVEENVMRHENSIVTAGKHFLNACDPAHLLDLIHRYTARFASTFLRLFFYRSLLAFEKQTATRTLILVSHIAPRFHHSRKQYTSMEAAVTAAVRFKLVFYVLTASLMASRNAILWGWSWSISRGTIH
jgi:hypothetical protein